MSPAIKLLRTAASDGGVDASSTATSLLNGRLVERRRVVVRSAARRLVEALAARRGERGRTHGDQKLIQAHRRIDGEDLPCVALQLLLFDPEWGMVRKEVHEVFDAHDLQVYNWDEPKII